MMEKMADDQHMTIFPYPTTVLGELSERSPPIPHPC